MIKDTVVSLRPVVESDMEEVHRGLIDIEARGPWYPMPRTSLTKFRARFNEAAFWSADEGIFVMVDDMDRLIGFVDWNKLNGDVPDIEPGYRVIDPANWRKGLATEALALHAGWLFDGQPINRLRLVIHVDNVGSHRVAEKCGFLNEGTWREAWYHTGKWHDMDIYPQTRAESEQRRRIPHRPDLVEAKAGI